MIRASILLAILFFNTYVIFASDLYNSFEVAEYISTYVCPSCRACFSDAYVFDDHMSLMHVNDAFICTDCKAFCATLLRFKNHIKKSHSHIFAEWFKQMVAYEENIAPISDQLTKKSFFCTIDHSEPQLFSHYANFIRHVHKLHKNHTFICPMCLDNGGSAIPMDWDVYRAHIKCHGHILKVYFRHNPLR